MNFKPIIGLEDTYLISDTGVVWSVKSGKNLKCGLCTQGYPMAKLFVSYCAESSKRVYKYIRVHRLVAIHFLPNPDELPMINHIDGDKTNNHVDNLEWCTQKHNVSHAIETGLLTPKKPLLTEDQLQDCEMSYSAGVSIATLADRYQVSRSAIERNISLSPQGRQAQKEKARVVHKNTFSVAIRQLTKDGEFIQEWFSLNDAAKALSINVGNISNVLTGRQKSAGGYRWERV